MPYQTLKRSAQFINSVSVPKRAAKPGGRRAGAFTAPGAPVELQDKTAQAVVAGSFAFRHLTVMPQRKGPAPQREKRARRKPTKNQFTGSYTLVFPCQNANRNASCISRGWFT